MNYLAIALNHFRAVQNWLHLSGADANLNLANFELEVRRRQRYYRLFPQFLTKKDGHYIYSPSLGDEVVGFIGWLPYRPISWAPANDKLIFKKFIEEKSERTPRFWAPMNSPPCDFIVKSSAGSFGDGLVGPLQASHFPSYSAPAPHGTRGILFAEEFIQGEILKVWFWGKRPVYAQRRSYPEVYGDGLSTLRELLENRMFLSGKSLSSDDPDHATLLTVLRYQQHDLDTIPGKGERIWLDYRYGRNYARNGMRTTTDNALPAMAPQLINQIVRVGEKVYEEANKQFAVPVLFSIDAVIDADAQVWWLEANSNPTLPPDGYTHVFSSLFGMPAEASDASLLKEESLLITA